MKKNKGREQEKQIGTQSLRALIALLPYDVRTLNLCDGSCTDKTHLQGFSPCRDNVPRRVLSTDLDHVCEIIKKACRDAAVNQWLPDLQLSEIDMNNATFVGVVPIHLRPLWEVQQIWQAQPNNKTRVSIVKHVLAELVMLYYNISPPEGKDEMVICKGWNVFLLHPTS